MLTAADAAMIRTLLLWRASELGAGWTSARGRTILDTDGAIHNHPPADARRARLQPARRVGASRRHLARLAAQPTDWPDKLDTIRWVYAEMVRKNYARRSVRLLVNSKSAETQARRTPGACRPIHVAWNSIAHPTNRGWMRDSGPVFVRRRAKRRTETAIVHFHFNAWPSTRLAVSVLRLRAAARHWTAVAHPAAIVGCAMNSTRRVSAPATRQGAPRLRLGGSWNSPAGERFRRAVILRTISRRPSGSYPACPANRWGCAASRARWRREAPTRRAG